MGARGHKEGREDKTVESLESGENGEVDVSDPPKGASEKRGEDRCPSMEKRRLPEMGGMRKKQPGKGPGAW